MSDSPCTSSNASADAEPTDASADVVDDAPKLCFADAESTDASCTPGAQQICTVSLDAYSTQNECVRDWDTARDPCAWSFPPIVLEQVFAGYQVIDQLFVDTHWYFYDIATKQLVAVGVLSGNSNTMSCLGGPQGLVVRGPCLSVSTECCATYVGCATMPTCAWRDH